MSNIRMRVAAPEALRMSTEPVRVVEAVSPKVSFESVEGGVRVTVQDVEGTHVTLIPAGRGEQGVGIASIAMNADYTLTITLDDGSSYTTPSIRGKAGADGAPGKDGQDGTDGVSPSVTVTDITGGHRVTITDAEHPQGISFDVMNGQDGGGAVQDVQVNGTSVVTDGVANVPIAGPAKFGVIQVSGYGLQMQSNGYISTKAATAAEVKAGQRSWEHIAPYTQHQSAFYGLAKAAGDTTQSASSNAVGDYTETAKSKISEMLNGSVPVTGTTPTITALSGIQYVCGEVSTLDITLPASGIVDVVFTSGSTPTVLTITPPTGMTVEWANGFDSTALEADTMYKINVKMVGTKCLGVAASWS